ncbi:MAG: DUF2970 domain-containing protein [Pseudomonadota bacterium]|nr:DUF2970 domain-containing protein [Pseudomonadota bacterium]
MNGDLRQAARRKGSFAQTARAVAWSFFGVRKGSDLEKDVQHLNPIHVVIAALLGAALLIALLLGIVHWVLASGAAQ